VYKLDVYSGTLLRQKGPSSFFWSRRKHVEEADSKTDEAERARECVRERERTRTMRGSRRERGAERKLKLGGREE